MASYVYRTRLFRPEEGLGPQEPEIRPDSVGVALSGGGSRSLVAAMGQLRGLRHLGVMDRVWGISAASGGSWAAVPYVYLPSKFCEDAFLGAVVQDPGELTWFRHRGKPRETALDSLPQHNLGAVAQHLGVLAMLEEAKKLIGRGFLPDETWPMAVGRNVLHPFGLFDPDARGFQRRSFTWSEASFRDDVEQFNTPDVVPSLAREKFRMVERDGRPFVIVNTAIVPWRGEPDLLPFEITPLAAGLPGFYARVGPGDRDLGGGRISPFAVGSTRPASGDDHTAEATRPVRPFSLADMIGVSSVAPAEELQTRVPELDALIPRAMLWPVRGFELPRNSAWPYLFTDGGSLENTAVIALLRRPLKRIVSFLNCETPLGRDRVTGQVVVDAMLPPLFGYQPHSSGRPYERYPEEVDTPLLEPSFGVFRYNQVFCAETFLPAIEGLWNAASDGGPAIFRQQGLKVRSNDRFGVGGGNEVDLLWVYNHRAPSFMRRLHWTVCLGMALPFSGFHDFPRYGTSVQMRLHARQINLLAHLATWSVIGSETDTEDRVAGMFAEDAGQI